MSSWHASEEYRAEGEVEAAPAAEHLDSARDTAEFDALPVLAREQVLTPTYHRAGGAERVRSVAGFLPAVQAAAAAAGGFLAGAVIVSFLQRRQRRALARRRAGAARRGVLRRRKPPQPSSELLQVVASRSLLVDVHLLGDRR